MTSEPGETSGDAPERRVLVVADMMFSSKVRGAGIALGVPVAVRGRADGLPDAVHSIRARLILIDLEIRAGDAAAAIRELKADPRTSSVTVIGFSSHTNSAAIASGRASGADRVLARSAFVAALPELLAGGFDGSAA